MHGFVCIWEISFSMSSRDLLTQSSVASSVETSFVILASCMGYVEMNLSVNKVV